MPSIFVPPRSMPMRNMVSNLPQWRRTVQARKGSVSALHHRTCLSAFFSWTYFRRIPARAGLGCGHVSGHDEQIETVALLGLHPTGADQGPPARTGRAAGAAGRFAARLPLAGGPGPAGIHGTRLHDTNRQGDGIV